MLVNKEWNEITRVLAYDTIFIDNEKKYNTVIYNNLEGPRNRLLVRKLVIGYYEGMEPQNQQVYYQINLYPNLEHIYGQETYKICQCMEYNEVIQSTSRTDSAKHTNLVF
jgi:hypothetical protein